jgi:nitrous oxide reductase accessory protein NosL
MKSILISLVLLSNLISAYDMNYNKETRGLVRHIEVYKDPKWVCKIDLQNGKEIFFVSPKSMFEFYLRPAKWPEFDIKSENDFKDIYVTDYATTKAIKAKGAFFVYGSNETSPAGDDLVAFDSYKAAEEFLKANNGKRIFGFRDINQGLINWLNDSL